MVRHPVLAFEAEPAHRTRVRLLPGVRQLVSVEVVNVPENFAADVAADVPPGPLPLACVQRHPAVLQHAGGGHEGHAAR